MFGLSTIRAYIFLGMCGVILILTAVDIGQFYTLSGKNAEIKAANDSRDTFKSQVDAFAKTHADDITNMNTCKAVLSDQSDAIAHLQLSLTATNDSAAKYAAESDADLRTLSDRIAEQQAFIDKNPDRVCRLTPEMRQRAESRVWK